MKVQCSCGVKYEFDITTEMANSPVKFVCPACGLDASEFVDALVRQELGQAATPHGVPVPARLSAPPGAAPVPVARAVAAPPPPSPPPPSRPALAVRIQAPQPAQPEEASAPSPADVPCLKHPGQFATRKCLVCGKPICPKCMELFGYVCSPLCKAKAETQGREIPVYAGQKSVVEARLWRKVVWIGGTAGLAVAGLLGFWFWYAWFGCLPRPVFSVRFTDPAYSGQSLICGKDSNQVVFLHGDTLARYDMKPEKEVWSRQLIDRKEIEAAATRQIKDMEQRNFKLRDNGITDVPRIPSLEKLVKEDIRAAAAQLTLYVRGQNVWVASPGKLVRYDWETGNPVKELSVQPGYGGLISRGDELMLVNADGGRPVITHINLATCESRSEDLEGAPSKALAASESSGTGKAGVMPAGGARGSQMAGLPLGMPGKDAGKAMDPAKVAEQAQHLSLPARIALPALIAGNMSQERTLAELNSDQSRPAAAAHNEKAGPGSYLTLLPTKDGFVEFSTRLLERRIVERSAMKPAPAKSALDSNLTAANSMKAAGELLNEMQRARGGDIVREDVSRYEVTLRRPGSAETWTGEVDGPPRLYPLQTVNVLAANKLILVFNKDNKKLWQNSLNYNVVAPLGALDEESAPYGQGPCVERKGTLYVFDQGVLTAFELATGNVRWRLPSVGIAGLFFDDQDMLYLNTSTASPESIKYSRQIDISQKTGSVVLKVDPRNGRVLWSAEPGGLVNHVYGKYIFVVQSYMPPESDEEDWHTVHTGFETPPYLRVKRLNPRNGHEVWEYFQQRAPLDIAFEKNTIRVVFKKEVQVLQFMAF